MPALTTDRSATPDSYPSSDGGADWTTKARILSDEEYAVKFPADNQEKPLSQQLEPIAVVGMGCRLPGDVSSPAGFWEMMMQKKSGRTDKVPASRFNIDAHLHPNNERPGSFNVPGGHFLSGNLQEFDPSFFNISPVEAMWMDPQQRKLLEVVYEALESGGIGLEAIEGTRTAVFAATFTADYQQMSFKEPDFRHSYAATGVDPGILSNRISHVFNLSGPSITVNTACSSSIYAMHNACNALRNGECEGALVGGTNLILTVDQHMNTAKLGVLSPDSVCHTFDAAANGYSRAEAAGAVYLKRLSDALRDGDPVRGVLRSSAVNSNGKVAGVGITYPNMEGQYHVIRQAYERGGQLDPRWTGYFEIHGTGTPVGDPIEVHAVARAMNKEDVAPKAGVPWTEPLWIGAVKTNIGHSEAASGLSAIIKAVLTVEHAVIPPTRGLENPNPAINWKRWHVKVPTEAQPFPAYLPVTRVSVNSFGYGGTNGHFIVESVDSLVAGYVRGQRRTGPPGNERGVFHRRRPYLLTFSAHDAATLQCNIAAHGRVLGQYGLLDVAYTLAERRTKLASRGFVVSSPATAEADFADVATRFVLAERRAQPATVGFVFTGQGAQWAGMARELLVYYPSFRRTIEQLDAVLGRLPNGPDWTLQDVLQESAAESRIHEAEFSQPLCTAVQMALVDLLEAWGVTPAVTVGHSSGEIAAAYAAGLVGFDDAIVAAYFRGRAAKAITSHGAMMVVGLGAEEVEPYLAAVASHGQVVVACHNSPSLVTLSGDRGAIDALQADLDAANVFARIVKTNGKAYHSAHMKPAASVYLGLLEEAAQAALPPTKPRKPARAIMVSSVTNTLLDSAVPLDAHYWCANLVSPVRFQQAVQTIGSHDQLAHVDLLIEVGPHAVLRGPAKQIFRAHQLDRLSYLPTLERGKDAAAQMLALAGQLFLRGVPLDYARVVAIEEETGGGGISLKQGRLLVDLPTYQWHYAKDLWAEARQSAEQRAPQQMRHDTLGARLPGGSAFSPAWRNRLRMLDLPWLRHHSLGGEAVFPAAGYFSMAIEAATQLNEAARQPQTVVGYTLRDVVIQGALVIPDTNDGIETLVSLHPSAVADADDAVVWWDFEVASCADAGHHWTSHITGRIAINTRPRPAAPPRTPPTGLSQRTTGAAWNAAFRAVGFDYGPSFQDMQDVRSDGQRYVATAASTLKRESGLVVGPESRYVLHPATIDANLQLVLVSIFAGRVTDMACGAVPVRADEVSVWLPSAADLAHPDAVAYAWTDERGQRFFASGTQLVASSGDVVLAIDGLRCVSYEAAVPQTRAPPIPAAPFAELAWAVDIDALTADSPVSQLTTADLVGLAGFKNPGSRVLAVDVVDPVALAEKAEGRIRLTAATTAGKEAVEKLAEALVSVKHTATQGLDLLVDLDGQDGLAAEQFDVVIPGGILNADQLRWLLKPGGRVIGPHDQLVSLDQFSLLPLAGGLTIATKASGNGKSVNGKSDANHAIVYRSHITDFAQALFLQLENVGRPTFVPLAQAHEATDAVLQHIVVVADLEGPLLATLDAAELAGLQHLVTHATDITWVSAAALQKATSPQEAMALGLTRSLRAELASLDLTVVDVNLDNTSTDVAVAAIVDIIDRHSGEHEYSIDSGLVHISRLVPATALNDVYGPPSAVVQTVPLRTDDALVGLPQAGPLIFTHDTRVDSDTLGPDDVQVRVLHAGLTKEDVLVREGTDSLTAFSHAIYGEVMHVGGHVTTFRVGDRVLGLHPDRLATIQTVPAALLVHADAPDAVTLPLAYATALHALDTLARVAEGDIVLVLQGTGSAGSAAVALARLRHAVPYVAVRSEGEALRAATALDLPPQQILTGLDGHIQTALALRTGGRTADVVLSVSYVSTNVAHEAWRAIAPFGRFVEIGRKHGTAAQPRPALDPAPATRGASYHAFDILDLWNQKPARLAAYLHDTATLLCEHPELGFGHGTPPVHVHAADYDRAVAGFSDDLGVAPTIVDLTPDDDHLLQVRPTRPPLTFRPDATYFLVGCLGGLGRSLTAWMTDRGAKHFAFMSRTGVNTPETAAWLRKIEAKTDATCQIIRGDASRAADVDAALDSIPAALPVKGVVHAAMVLRDGMFRTMTHDAWTQSITPKVAAGLNLHAALQKRGADLDFFVATSSTSGLLGTPGQANYASANNFLDSLACHRVHSGLPATSLLLPMVLSVGVVAENPEIEAALRRKGIYGIDEAHLLDAFEAAMAPTTTADHIIVGMDPQKLAKALASDEVTDSFWTDDPRFRTVMRIIDDATASSSGGAGAGAGFTILQAIREAGAAAPAQALVVEHFTEKLSRLLLLDRAVFEPEVLPITGYGLDSMIGAELRNWIFREYALDIPFQRLNGPDLTIAKFAALVVAQQGLE